MTDEPKTGLVPLLLIKGVCCGGLLLLASGTLSGIGAWLLDDGPIWLVPGGVAVTLIVLWRRRNGSV